MAVGKIIGRAIATDAIGADQIAAGAITVADIPDGEITDVKLHTTLDFSAKTFTMADAHVTQTMVTQHQAALSITESQISDLQSYVLDNDSPTFTNTTLTGYLAGPATFTIDPAGVGDNTGTVVIAGNLQVDGTTTTINSTTMTVDDLNITLASGAANAAAANGAGLTVDGASATIIYNGTTDEWEFNKRLQLENNEGLHWGTGSGRPYIKGDQSLGTLQISDGGTPVITIKSDSVGIGTDSPGGLLDVYTASDRYFRIKSNNADLELLSDNNTNPVLRIQGTGTGDLVNIYDNTQEVFTILDGGNVGIGTGDPDTISPNNSKLAVYDGGNRAGITLATASASGVNTIYFADGTAGTEKYRGIVEYQHAVDQLNLYASATRVATITTSGIEVNSGSFRTDQVRHSIRPTLNLDFANSKQLDPRITFYRDSIATYYDSKGVLRYANRNEPRFDHDPVTGESKGLLIEESRTNTTPYSQHIISGYGWGVSGVGSFIQPYAGVAPDGTYSASRLFFADASHAISINNTGAWTAGATVTTSMWIKGTQGETMRFASGGADFGNITLTGEWQRVEGTRTTVNTYTNINTYGGATARDVLVWGAQAEVASFATSYVPSDTRFASRSTTATYHDETGILRTAPSNGARYGYKYDGRKWTETGLILEQGATNRTQNFLNLATGTLYWSTGQNSEPVHNTSITSPDGSYNVIKQEINSTANAIHSIYKNSAVSAGTQLCCSVYAKAAEYDRIYLYTDGVAPTIGGVYYDLANGTISGGPLQNYQGYGIEDVGNGWYRCWFSGTPTSNTQAYFHIDICQSDNSRTFVGALGEGVYLWGPQMEYSASPSSYIYTVDQTVTRNADVATSTAYTREQDKTYLDNIDKYEWFNQDQGTIYTDITPIDHDPASGTYFVFNLTDKTTENTITLRYGDIISGTDLFMKSFDTVEVDLTSFASAADSQMKAAVAYEQDNAGFSVNGETAKVDTTYRTTNLTYLALSGTETGYLAASHHIKKLSYYPVRLTNAEIQALTENN